MKIEKVFVSPEMAAKMLVKNTNNRRLDPARITRYANDITNGRWVADTGELIKLDSEGNVLDGQHRLSAVVRSGKGIWIHLATGVASEVFDVIDSGKSRSVADVLTIAGVPNAHKVSAFVQAYNQMRFTKLRAHKTSIESAMTAKMVLKFYQENAKWVDDVVHKSTNFYSQFQRVWNSGEVTLFYALLTDADQRLGYEFMRQLCQGVDITNDTIILMRNRLIADKVNVAKQMLNSHRRALIIKAWNAFYLGKTLKVIKYNPEVEEYPKILGLEE